MTIFGELDFRMSIVQRWGVVSTLRKQSVAEHSFNVAIIAMGIAQEWLGITDPDLLFQLVRRCLRHDALEAVTGDPPSYMKSYVDSLGVAEKFGLEDTFDLSTDHEVVRIIAKVADYIDALIFLQMESSHGNNTVMRHIVLLESQFRAWLEATKYHGVSITPWFQMYVVHIWEPLFGQNGQFYATRIWPDA